MKGVFMAIKKSERMKSAVAKQVKNSEFFRQDISKIQRKQLNDSILLRINKDYKNLLGRHFMNDRGLNLSNGIRMLVHEYMKDKNLI